jgi:hypothetical protein
VAKETASSSTEPENNDELEQITIARALLNYRLKEKMAMSNPNAPIPFQQKFQIQNIRPTSSQPSATTSKILPLICQKARPRYKPSPATANENPRSRHTPAAATNDKSMVHPPQSSALESRVTRPLRFPAAGAAPYVPIRQMRSPCHGIAPPVAVRTIVPVFSAPPLPPPASVHQVIRAPPVRVAPPVSIRQAVPVYAAPPPRKEEPAPVQKDLPASNTTVEQDKLPAKILEMDKTENNPHQSETLRSLDQLKI